MALYLRVTGAISPSISGVTWASTYNWKRTHRVKLLYVMLVLRTPPPFPLSIKEWCVDGFNHTWMLSHLKIFPNFLKRWTWLVIRTNNNLKPQNLTTQPKIIHPGRLTPGSPTAITHEKKGKWSEPSTSMRTWFSVAKTPSPPKHPPHWMLLLLMLRKSTNHLGWWLVHFTRPSTVTTRFLAVGWTNPTEKICSNRQIGSFPPILPGEPAPVPPLMFYPSKVFPGSDANFSEPSNRSFAKCTSWFASLSQWIFRCFARSFWKSLGMKSWHPRDKKTVGFRVLDVPPFSKLTWQAGKAPNLILIFNRRYIIKWLVFYRPVSFWGVEV